MAATLKGLAVNWGVATTATVGAVISTGKRQSADFNNSGNIQELLDENGVRVGVAVVESEKTLTITVVPAGATADAASTEANAIIPTPGEAVTITSSNVDAGAAVDIAGAYVAEGSRIRETNTGAMLIEIDLYQASEIASYTTIT